jgi:hypothetical protein
MARFVPFKSGNTKEKPNESLICKKIDLNIT